MEVNEFDVVISITSTYSEMPEKRKKGVTFSSVYEICNNFDKTSRKSIAKCFSVGIVHKFRLSYKVNLRELIWFYSPLWFFDDFRESKSKIWRRTLTQMFLAKVNNGNTRTKCVFCSELTLETPKRRHWRRSCVFIVNFEQISHIVLVFPLFILSK